MITKPPLPTIRRVVACVSTQICTDQELEYMPNLMGNCVSTFSIGSPRRAMKKPHSCPFGLARSRNRDRSILSRTISPPVTTIPRGLHNEHTYLVGVGRRRVAHLQEARFIHIILPDFLATRK